MSDRLKEFQRNVEELFSETKSRSDKDPDSSEILREQEIPPPPPIDSPLPDGELTAPLLRPLRSSNGVQAKSSHLDPNKLLSGRGKLKRRTNITESVRTSSISDSAQPSMTRIQPELTEKPQNNVQSSSSDLIDLLSKRMLEIRPNVVPFNQEEEGDDWDD